MNINDILQLLIQNLRQTSILEYIAVITGLLSVWYARKESILVYPVGIVSVLIYVWLCFHAGLYADMGINGFYFFMSLFGWYKWTRKNIRTVEHRPISRSGRKINFAGILVTGVSFVTLYWLLSTFTDSTVPLLDSFTTAIFIVGMWLMALKKIENWIYWIIGDTVCIFLFPYKGLFFSGFQYLFFLVLAISGFFEWSKRWKLQQQTK